jgi:hypothetical protein
MIKVLKKIDKEITNAEFKTFLFMSKREAFQEGLNKAKEIYILEQYKINNLAIELIDKKINYTIERLENKKDITCDEKGDLMTKLGALRQLREEIMQKAEESNESNNEKTDNPKEAEKVITKGDVTEKEKAN